VSQFCVKISTEFFIPDGLTGRVRLVVKIRTSKANLLANGCGGFREEISLLRV